MHLQQISVFLENVPGSLLKFTQLLEKREIDLLSISLADTTHFGIARCIVSFPEQVVPMLRESGYTVKVNDVLGVCVQDRPGGLCDVLQKLADEEVSVEYLYSFARHIHGRMYIIVRVDQTEKAEDILLSAGMTLLQQEDIADTACEKKEGTP